MLEAYATVAASSLEAKITIGGREYDAPSAAWHTAEQMRARSLVEKIASSRYQEVRQGLPESLVKEEQQISEAFKAFAAQLAGSERGPDDLSPAQKKSFEGLRSRVAAHQTALDKYYPRYAWLDSVHGIPLKELPLKPGEVVLQYAIGLRTVILFVIRDDHTLRLIRLPVGAKDLETEVQVFRDLLVGRRFSAKSANDLFQHVGGDALPKETRELIIIPDGFLGLFPFEALVTKLDAVPASYLGTEYPISYAQSVSAMTLLRALTRETAAKPLFAVADPLFRTNDGRSRLSLRWRLSRDSPGRDLHSRWRMGGASKARGGSAGCAWLLNACAREAFPSKSMTNLEHCLESKSEKRA